MMKQPLSVLSLMTLAVVGSAPLLAADDPVAKDLRATIALQGYPCDQIVSSKRNADSDYTASCKDGNRYHVFVNSQGRVIVEKL
ncbi:MAG TPA: hypothetical protein VE907_08850 [Gammaproteobacteria bacterium]|nr:hypothetical protein [Gammaproteobacteria bacterium]